MIKKKEKKTEAALPDTVIDKMLSAGKHKHHFFLRDLTILSSSSILVKQRSKTHPFRVWHVINKEETKGSSI